MNSQEMPVQNNNQDNNNNINNQQNPASTMLEMQDDHVGATKIKYHITDLNELSSLNSKEDGIGCIDIALFSKNNSADDSSLEQSQSDDFSAQNSDESQTSQNRIDTTLMGSFVEQFYPNDVWFLVSNLSDGTIIEEFSALSELINRGYGNVGVIIPGVIEPGVIDAIKTAASTAQLDLSKLKLGLYIENAAQVFLAEEFVKVGIHFALINADELARSLISGISPNYGHATHPVIVKAMCNVLKTFKHNRVHSSVMGVFLDNMDFINHAVSYGVDSFTVLKEKVSVIKTTAHRFEKSRMIELMKERHRMQFNQQ